MSTLHAINLKQQFRDIDVAPLHPSIQMVLLSLQGVELDKVISKLEEPSIEKSIGSGDPFGLTWIDPTRVRRPQHLPIPLPNMKAGTDGFTSLFRFLSIAYGATPEVMKFLMAWEHYKGLDWDGGIKKDTAAMKTFRMMAHKNPKLISPCEISKLANLYWDALAAYHRSVAFKLYFTVPIVGLSLRGRADKIPIPFALVERWAAHQVSLELNRFQKVEREALGIMTKFGFEDQMELLRPYNSSSVDDNDGMMS